MFTTTNEKHLDLLQGVITRMATNSFLLKGWSVTLVAALLALAADGAKPALVAIALLPTLTFWGLDGYFLAQERLFRDLYARVIDPAKSIPDFSLKTDPCPFLVWLKAVFSPTLLAFHGTVLMVLAIVLLFVICNASGAPVPTTNA